MRLWGAMYCSVPHPGFADACRCWFTCPNILMARLSQPRNGCDKDCSIAWGGCRRRLGKQTPWYGVIAPTGFVPAIVNGVIGGAGGGIGAGGGAEVAWCTWVLVGWLAVSWGWFGLCRMRPRSTCMSSVLLSWLGPMIYSIHLLMIWKRDTIQRRTYTRDD